MSPHADSLDELNIAPRLKSLRERRGLSLRELGRRTGIAVSFLSALEKGHNNVSVAKLKNLLDALDTSMGEFFSAKRPSRERVVYRAQELVEISGSSKGVSYREVAAGRPGRALQLIVEHYEPGADTGPGSYRHNAEEAGVVLSGTLELTIEGKTYVLGPGDSYYFDSRRPHRLRNPGRVPVEAISVNTPPSF